MNLMISPVPANASGSSCGKGKSGSRTDQLGNWKRRLSQRSLRQRFGDAVAFEHEMRKAALLQPMAHGKPGLPPPITSVFDAFSWHGAPPSAGRSAPMRRA